VDDRARIVDQLQRTLEGGAWHGPAVLELLEGVTASQAHAHPIPGGHSIWELVLHLAGTYRLVLRRVQGDARNLSREEDWPAVPEPTEADWREALDALRALNAEAQRVVAGFDASKLDEPLVTTPPYTAWVQFIGLTQHDIYHAGQIALLKRALSPRDAVGQLAFGRVVVLVRDYDAALAFYKEAFGVRVVFDAPSPTGDRYLHVVLESEDASGTHAPAAGFWFLRPTADNDRVGRQTGGEPLAVLYATDVHVAVARVQAAGGALVQPVRSADGASFAHVADLYGNEFVLVEMPVGAG